MRNHEKPRESRRSYEKPGATKRNLDKPRETKRKPKETWRDIGRNQE
jgi:hypothetical protein